MHQLARILLIAFEIALLSALILATRCANYQEVFIGGNIYFTDADCYARMTRIRMVADHPGLVLRHHDFENYPNGTTPHTTAPLDYLILGLSILLKPVTAHALDLAGAAISPLLALIGGWFVYCWSVDFRYRWALLILYAISPILVHGTELGRPDHQSLSMLLVMIAICAEWRLQAEQSSRWSIVSGIAWGLALWVSLYEPLILLVLILASHAVIRFVADPHPNLLPQGEGISGTMRDTIARDEPITALREKRSLSPAGRDGREAPVRATHLFARDRRIGWILFGAVIAIAFLIERRVPSWPVLRSSAIFSNWAHTIGELAPVSPANPIWLRWTGYLLLVGPLLIWFVFRKRTSDVERGRGLLTMIVLLVATYALTIWQARWGYFFVLIFALALPALLEPIRLRVPVWIAFALSIFSVLKDWDERLWPTEAELARRAQRRYEEVQIRDLATGLRSPEVRAFLAPWWLSPAIAYWSGQPGVAGSSHESLGGIEASARFFLSSDWAKAREILEKRKVEWVLAYDSERIVGNSAAVLGLSPTGHELCSVLDRTPTQAPRFLIFAAQNGVAKLYRVVNNL